jgi:putative methyltransferase
MKRHVYLCQVNSRFGDQAFLPYSAGMIQAYCQHQEGIVSQFEFQPFLFLREDIPALVAGMTEPAVVGLSCYIWNWEYNKTLAKAIKTAYPNCLIVMGGPQVPIRSGNFFQCNSYVDILVHHEGEHAFAEILLESLNKKPNFTQIAGLSVKVVGNNCVRTDERLRLQDPDQLPSPYLEGVFDDLVKLPYRWNASHETNRGCPYSCTFCDWGSAVYTRLRHFDIDRLSRELEWFGRNNIEILYNCDANFGILPHDLPLAKKLAEVKREYGFPMQFRPSFAKKSSSAVFEIAKVLQEVGLQRGITLSMQSMSDECLEAIKRRNIKTDNLAELLNLYRSHQMPTYTELILGLPGETYESFRAGISRLFSLGQHEGLLIYLCELLPNSEMASDAYLERYALRTIRMPIMLGYTIPGDDEVTEYFDVVIETSRMPFADWQRSYLLAWAAQCFHCLNITQLIAIFCWYNHAIPYHLFYEEFLTFMAANPDSMLGRFYAQAVDVMNEAVDKGVSMGRPVPGYGKMTWYPEEASFLGMIRDKNGLYANILTFFAELVRRHGLEISPELQASLIEFQCASLVDPSSPRQISLQAGYDFPRYFDAAYYGAPVELAAGDFGIQLHADSEYHGNLADYAIGAVRFGRKNNGLRRRAVLS